VLAIRLPPRVKVANSARIPSSAPLFILATTVDQYHLPEVVSTRVTYVPPLVSVPDP
jgi:hypothetical protein